MKKAFLLSLSLLLSSALFAQSPAETRRRLSKGESVVLDDQLIVKYKSDVNKSARLAAAAAVGARVLKGMDVLNADVLKVAPSQMDALIDRLKRNPDVEFVEKNAVMRAFADPNDTDFSSQYYLDSAKLDVVNAWAITEGDPDVVVAVLDTGVSLTHPDLVNNLWDNPAPSATSGAHGARMQIDWNSDGDCTDIDPQTGPDMCLGPDPTDDNGPEFHGTHVAGIIAATTNNNLSIAGIARNSRLMAVKVLNDEGLGSLPSIADGIIYAANNGASVINLSLGGPQNSGLIASAVNYAINVKNVVVVAASGNTLNPPCSVNYPAALDNVIAVGATTENDTLAGFSCTGSQLDLTAPGVNILSTNSSSGTSTLDGTSFSSPMVAGVAALIRALSPGMSVGDVTRYIDFTADFVPGQSGFNNSFGFGRLNAFRAVQAASQGKTFISNPASPNETFAYPNPYRPLQGTRLLISIPQSIGSNDIKIDIRNVAGELVKELSGTNAWDGRNSDGDFVASGLYYYYVKTSAGDTKGKFMVVK